MKKIILVCLLLTFCATPSKAKAASIDLNFSSNSILSRIISSIKSGPVGVTGATGIPGPVGATGPQGVTGETGPSGPIGPMGNTGLQGYSGIQGQTGPTGASGLIGATGIQGLQGATGIQGATGPKGDSAILPISGYYIMDIAQMRGGGPFPQPPVDTTVPTNDLVKITCTKSCLLWVNYDVNTRNSDPSTPGSGGWAHSYSIFIDGQDQAVYNGVHLPVPYQGLVVAVNGVFPVSAGEHTVQIYVRKNGGTLEQFTSHLQVMALGKFE